MRWKAGELQKQEVRCKIWGNLDPRPINVDQDCLIGKLKCRVPTLTASTNWTLVDGFVTSKCVTISHICQFRTSIGAHFGHFEDSRMTFDICLYGQTSRACNNLMLHWQYRPVPE